MKKLLLGAAVLPTVLFAAARPHLECTTDRPGFVRVSVTRAGLADTCCPPSGLASYYNSIRGPKSIDWWQGASHSGNPYNGQHCVLKEEMK